MRSLDIAGELLSGRYSLLREIGRGGMAVVHLARDVENDGLVAVKVLRHDIASAVNVERFLREVRLAEVVRHENVLPLLNSGTTAEGLPYFVMPHVDGESLRQRLERETRLPVEEAISIVRQVADALSAAHEMGIVHRDVTPANILLAGERAFLSDFGIARAVLTMSGDRITGTGIVMGTPEFMSPEQAAGERDLDARADLYSLASVLYLALAGEPPFTGPTPQAVLARKAVARAPIIRDLRPTVPVDVARAIARALEPVPADRQQSVAVFAAQLDAGMLHPEVTSRPPLRWLAAAGVVALLSYGAYSRLGDHDPIGAVRRDVESGTLSSALANLRRGFGAKPHDAPTALWLAQALVLTGQDTGSDWSRATAVLRGPNGLRGGDSALAVGLAALAAHRYDVGCPAFRELARIRQDMPAQVDLALCLARDNAVVRDGRAASGWSFRASRHEAVARQLALLEQLPPAHEVRTLLHRTLPSLLTTEWTQLQRGIGADDSASVYEARPFIVRTPTGDTVAYDVHPRGDFFGARTLVDPPGYEAALEHDRRLYLANATAWVQEDSSAAPAHAMLARALELIGSLDGPMDGDPTALGEMRRARLLVHDRGRELTARFAEVRVLVKLQRFEAARSLADSTLAQIGPPSERDLNEIAPLLALTGRATELATELSRSAARRSATMPDGRSIRLNATLQRTALVFSAYAQLGGPRDSIRVYRTLAEEQLRAFASSTARDSIRAALLARSYSLAVPILGPGLVHDLPPATPLLRAQQALARGDRDETRHRLTEMAATRSAHVRAAASLEQVVQEAWLRTRIGDDTGAARQLDDALVGLPAHGLLFMRSIAEAAAVGQALRLRSVVAGRLGDSVSEVRWRSAARAMLASADVELRP